jgi:hypothetical protein
MRICVSTIVTTTAGFQILLAESHPHPSVHPTDWRQWCRPQCPSFDVEAMAGWGGPGTAHGLWVWLCRQAEALDARLLAVPRFARVLVIALSIARLLVAAIPYVPRQYVDYSQTTLLKRVSQQHAYGPDTIADMYASKVILNDLRDMYSKRKLDQTPIEAATWSKAAASPYPPMMLLSLAALYAFGDWSGIGFYGAVLGLACAFLAVSLWCALNTRWYLFPLLFLNGSYITWRFVSVQDGSYQIMLMVILAALLLARRRQALGQQASSHALMAVAIAMKLSPLFYAKNLLRMSPRIAFLFLALLVVGLVVPYFVWDNYLSIYSFHNARSGDWNDAVGALAVVVPFTLVLWYVETRLDFSLEDRIGWDLVPFAMFLALELNAARHLVIVLLVPDRRGVRNIAAAIGLGLHDVLHALFPAHIRFGAVLYITLLVLVAGLIYYLDQIGWDTVRDDIRHPARTARLMLTRG